MKWSHLPVAGGLYDQHPQFLEEIAVIFQVRSEYQERKRKEDERKNRSKGGKGIAGRR
jgi:hypothetical protein